jgi:tRNA-Thr(GGU) m(6)t(6)A37 methyltransferase TsaA
MIRRQRTTLLACALFGLLAGGLPPVVAAETAEALPSYSMQPVGWIRKREGRTYIEIAPRYRPALLGVDKLDTLQVLWWFDRNDTPERRAILQVHPRGDPARPLTGVFATRSPFRPNLIALSEVTVIAVRDNLIEIDGIDAWADTPVLDLKP